MTERTSEANEDETSPLAKAIDGLALRSIGPAFMGGRIADIAVHPEQRSTWYVAVGSGGVWKTTNAGTTWDPVFDDQGSFSIGCVTIDPNSPEVIWVGTGEAVSGRHVAWGDGVYRSRNGGKTWERMGLDSSEHIAKILIDPRDSNTVYVAAEGPLWSSGGERGVYKSIDAGQTWQLTLEIDADTGVTSLAFAPDDPDTLYAAAYQRRRHVATFVGGGPGSGIYKSTDAGASWRRVETGLPKGDMGKIGLAATAADPRVVYATVEAEPKERGFYRSTDRGESWEKRNEYISGGTGPHYYQEIFASPVDADRVYQVDVFVHATSDGGKTFQNLETGKNKHSDNHVVWIDPGEPDHLLVGTDAGLYETFDNGTSYRHFPNLPISQFYRVAVDNSLPFTTVLAGAQDLGTLMGPLRTANVDGVRNQDWTVPLGADGYHVAFDPDDPQICYLEWQVGNVMRLDRRTNQLQDIQPQPAESDLPERWNWDCPIVVSPHQEGRIYLASQRVWRSDDRGDSWTPISGDLTEARNRYELPSFGAVQSVDALYDHMAMSQFSTISHMCESPVAADVLYVGTDDGLVHVSEDGGGSWQRCAAVPGLPDGAFINNVVASEHDADVVFVAADDHKHGDYTPYLFVSTDRGSTWQSMRGDLPDTLIVWCLAQDHVDPNLLFAGTEFGVYTSVDGGGAWHKLSGGMPTISIRDLAVQRRDGDLVCGSFGRGIYVLDDYSPLRGIGSAALDDEAVIFGVRDAWWYVPHCTAQAVGQPTLGSTAHRCANPEFGATVTYHLGSEVMGAVKQRQASEKEPRTAGDDVTFPGAEALWAEHVDEEPMVVVVIRNVGGDAIRYVPAKSDAGLHRVAWDLRLPASQPVVLEQPAFRAPWETDPQGPLVPPGHYSAEVAVVSGNGVRTLTEAQAFEVQPIPGVTERDDAGQALLTRTATLLREAAGAKARIEQSEKRIRMLRATMQGTPQAAALVEPLESAHRELADISRALVTDPIAERLSEPAQATVLEAIERVARAMWNTTQAPTATQHDAVESAATRLSALTVRLDACVQNLEELAAQLNEAGGTWA